MKKFLALQSAKLHKSYFEVTTELQSAYFTNDT